MRWWYNHVKRGTKTDCIYLMGYTVLWRVVVFAALTPPVRSTARLDSLWVKRSMTWWRHQMETFSALLAFCAGNSPVTGEFPSQRPVTRSFDVFFDLRPNKGLIKQWWGWWFQTPSAHYDVTVMIPPVQCAARLDNLRVKRATECTETVLCQYRRIPLIHIILNWTELIVS